MSTKPFACTAGPHTASLVIIGEAHGEVEERVGGIPFAGQAGRELARMFIDAGWDDDAATLSRAVKEDRDSIWLALREEWLQKSDIMLTNVFALRPINNNLGYLCAQKTKLSSNYAMPPLRSENPRYVKPDYLPHLSRLREEVERFRPSRKLLLALGGPACWALVGTSAIGRLRGAISASRGDAPAQIDGIKVLPTYHPAAILRAWNWRVIVIADLIKTKREREYAEIHRPIRIVLSSPTIEQVEDWTKETLLAGQSGNVKLLAPDIETMNGQIRCIGFARSASDIIVIPFVKDKTGGSYWPDVATELRAWYCVAELLSCPIPKVFQNGMFDLQYLVRVGLPIKNVLHDTMLLHHVLYPEMRKDLGFLGSIYTDESPWKLMRLKKGEEELKRDE